MNPSHVNDRVLRDLASAAPLSEEELHQRYDVTKNDVTKATQSIAQYERYAVVAKADALFAGEHPADRVARDRAERLEAFAEAYYKKHLEPFERVVLGFSGRPRSSLSCEPGVDRGQAASLASRSYADRMVAPCIAEDKYHIRVGHGNLFGSHEIPEMRAEMLRDEARVKARASRR